MELKEYLALFRRWWWLGILLILLGGAAALVTSLVRPPVYEATTTVLINQAPGALPDADAVLQGQRVAATYAELLHQRPVLEEVVANLGLNISPDRLERQLSVTPLLDTNLLELTVRDEDPVRAASIANEIVKVFVNQNVEFQESRYAASLANLQAEMDRTQTDIDEAKARLDTFDSNWTELTPEELAERDRVQALFSEHRATYASLLAQFEEVRLAQAQTTDKVTVVENALPGKRAGLSPIMMAIMGAIVGGMVSVGAVLLIEYLNDTIRSTNDIQTATELPTLAVIGSIRSSNNHRGALETILKPRSTISEAYRVLRTKLELASDDDPIKTVLVTSSLPLEGKTTTAANLAVVMAQIGRRTVLIDLDLRRPSVHELFQLSNKVGVTTALADGSGSRVTEHINTTPIDGLWVLTSGPLPPNPADLLQSQRVADLIEELEQQVDVVIIDSPPVLPVADPVLISRLCDATVLVALAGSTKQTALRDAKQQIVDMGSHVAGVVLNKVTSSRYYYTYYYYSDREE